jgi:hypothetical protein
MYKIYEVFRTLRIQIVIFCVDIVWPGYRRFGTHTAFLKVGSFFTKFLRDVGMTLHDYIVLQCRILQTKPSSVFFPLR